MKQIGIRERERERERKYDHDDDHYGDYNDDDDNDDDDDDDDDADDVIRQGRRIYYYGRRIHLICKILGLTQNIGTRSQFVGCPHGYSYRCVLLTPINIFFRSILPSWLVLAGLC